MDRIKEFITSNQYTDKIIWTIVFIILDIVITKVINRILYKAIKDNTKFYTAKKRVNYSITILMLVIIVFTWADSTTNLTTYAGLLSAGIAISLKELFTNVAGWLFISFRKPLEVGHRVLIGDQRGDVIDIRIFQFSLMEVTHYDEGEQSTGRIIDIPNHYVFLYPLINYTKGFEYIWNEIKVLITFESDWQLAKTLLTDIVDMDSEKMTREVKAQVRNAAKKYMIHYNKLTPIVYTDVKDCGVQLTLRYLCKPKQRRDTVNIIWEDILKMLAENDDIELAYPTRRVIN